MSTRGGLQQRLTDSTPGWAQPGYAILWIDRLACSQGVIMPRVEREG